MANDKSNSKPTEKAKQKTLPSPFDKFIEDRIRDGVSVEGAEI